MTLEMNNPQLTAYALGELPQHERAEVERVLAHSPDARTRVEETRRLAAMLERELAHEPSERLAEEQRRRLLDQAAQTGDSLPIAPRRRWALRIGGAAGLAAAACLAIVALRPGLLTSPARTAAPEALPVALRGDFNADGAVDIADAYLLARSIENPLKRSELTLQWDLNGDGHIDQTDVDAIAHIAVRLEERS